MTGEQDSLQALGHEMCPSRDLDYSRGWPRGLTAARVVVSTCCGCNGAVVAWPTQPDKFLIEPSLKQPCVKRLPSLSLAEALTT